MKPTKKYKIGTAIALGGVRTLVGGLMTAAACLVASQVAQAHIGYGGRDFGSYTGLSSGSKTITNQTVTGNYGWARCAGDDCAISRLLRHPRK